jgi:ABC-type nitrate/sulfonate/bicarbonate transport system permease component
VSDRALVSDAASVVPGASVPGRRLTLGRQSWLGPLIGTAGLIGLWELLAYTVFARSHLVPPPQEVLVTVFHDPGFEMWPNLLTTLEEAGEGFLWGNLVAVALAIAVVQLPFLETALLKLVLATYCMPIIAIGPVLEIVLSGTAPQSTLAGLSVVFTTLIGCLVGLRSADAVTLDLVRVYGGGRWRQLTMVRIRSALPAAFAGLAISGPAAVLGAIVGEYLGASQGLGVALISANEDLNARRAFAIAAVATTVAGVAYLAVSLAGRLLTPWAPRQAAAR